MSKKKKKISEAEVEGVSVPAVAPSLSKGKRRLFVALTAVILMGACEGAGRMAYNSAYDEKARKLLDAYLGLGGTYTPNMVSNYLPHHYLVYVLNGDTSAHEKYFSDKPGHRPNSLGYRGRDITKEKPAGTFRIVCLGGSTTFGLGETDETQTYPAQLEVALNTRFDSPHFEVVNAGTPGWSSSESLINLIFRVSALEPDMIVTYEGVNDTFAMAYEDEGGSDYGNFRRPVYYKPPSDWLKPLLQASVAARFTFVSIYKRDINFDINMLATKRPGSDRNANMAKATGKYFRRNLELIAAVAKDRGIKPVFVTMGHGPWNPVINLTAQITREVAATKGVTLVDFEPLSRPGMFAGDNIHLQRSGNQALGLAVADGIAAMNLGFVPKAH